MKKSTLLKFALAFSVAALTFSSCSKKDDPFIMAEMDAYAVQRVIKDEHTGNIRTVFVPNMMAWALSNVDIINHTFTKGEGIASPVASYTPFQGIFETDIETGYKDALTKLNGTYVFTATNANVQSAKAYANWNFTELHEFTTGWNEFAANEDDKKIRQFSYTNGRIDVKFKEFAEDVDDYYLIFMEPWQVSARQTYLVRQWGSEADIMKSIPVGTVEEEIFDGAGEYVETITYPGGAFSMSGFDDARYDGKKVFLAAVRNFGSEFNPMRVMLLSNPKTINIARGVFEEDEIPAPPEN